MAWKKIPERALDLSRAVMIDEGPSSVAAIASDASRKKTSISWWQREVWVYEPSAENMSLRPIFQISKHAKQKLFFQKLLVNNACFLKFWKISYRDIFSAAGSQMFWDRGTPVACCRKLSQRLIEKALKLSQVQLLRQHALRHGTRNALRHGKPGTQVGRWLIMYVFH